MVNSVVSRLVGERGLPGSNFVESEQEAARALLLDQAGYESGSSNVAPFELSRVSLPDEIVGAPLLEEALPRWASHYLEGEYGPMLREEG